MRMPGINELEDKILRKPGQRIGWVDFSSDSWAVALPAPGRTAASCAPRVSA